MIIKTIKQKQLDARKNKDKVLAGFLTTLISEIDIVGKNAGNRETTDSEAVKVVKKFVKGIEETIKLIKDETKIDALNYELSIYNEFLPKTMDEAATRVAIEAIIDTLTEKSPKVMGQVIGQLKTTYGDTLDAGLASKIIKSLLV